MKVLFVCGSPRKNGNTMTVINKICDKLEEYNIDILNLSDYKLNGCLGCSCCQKILDNPGCVQNDDISIILDKIMNADIVFYATPLFGFSYSGQMKLLLDRHTSLFKFISNSDKSVDEMGRKSFIENKLIGLIVTCQGPINNNTEIIQKQFDLFCETSLTKNLGKYIFPLCNENSKESEFSNVTINQIVNKIKRTKII